MSSRKKLNAAVDAAMKELGFVETKSDKAINVLEHGEEEREIPPFKRYKKHVAPPGLEWKR